MRLIDADRLNEVLNINFGHTGGADVLRQLIDIQPTVQAVPIDILDKIRAEIDGHCSDNRDRNDGLYIAMKIIDKYRAESEDKE